jgi:GAF domain-containing protein
VSDTTSDSTHAANPLLPETRSEIALPLLEGDRIIGALDVQSKYPGAFLQNDVQALQVMSNLLGTAIRNARLYETQAASLQDNKRLLFESETNLREIQRLNRQLTRKAWEEYQRTRFDALGVTLSPQGVQPGASWTEEMIDAILRQRPILSATGHDGVIAVPIVLRGEVLGAIEVTPGAELRPDDTVELIQAVAQRLALSLDNARLFEETQEATVQEQRINDIVARYQSAATVDDLLQITLAELSQSLGAAHGAIRLGSVSADQNGHQNGHDNGTHTNGYRANGGSA